MNKSGVIILGSSRSNGNTAKIVAFIQEKSGFDLIDLKAENISGYDYQHENREDDFIPLMKRIVEDYNTIIFATPVYWYAMSGIMKNFFDRITDCLQIEKSVGRKLRGKSMGMISCGSDADIKDGFSMPFVESAHYLGMQYVGDVHTWIEDENIPEAVIQALNSFVDTIKKGVPDAF